MVSRKSARIGLRTRAAVMAAAFGSVSSAQAMQTTRILHDGQTAERITALADLYLAVEFFHPDAATDSATASRWNAATAAAIEEVAADSSSFARAVQALVGTLADPKTVVGRADIEEADGKPRASRVTDVPRRALSYHGFPPQVRNTYGGNFKPFRREWRELPPDAPGTYRVDLPDGLYVDVRISEELPADGEPALGAVSSADSAMMQAYPAPGFRVIAAYRMLGVFRYFYPYGHLVDKDFEAAVRESIPRLLAAGDSVAYALAAAELASNFDDTHVGIQGPGWSAAADGAHAPVGFEIFPDGQVVVTRMTPDSVLAAAGIAPGDVILTVDGESIGLRMDSIARVTAASTPQALRGAVAFGLLGVGAEGSRVRLRMRRGEREFDAFVARTSDGWWRVFRHPQTGGPVVRHLSADIGYVDLTRLQPDGVAAAFDTLASTRAIIFDLRGYPRGTAWSIVPYLALPDTLLTARGWTRVARSPDPALVRNDSSTVLMPTERHSARYEGMTVLMLDGRAVSQAEFTGMMFRAATGTLFVGSPTNGANGNVTDIRLPGALRMSFTGDGIEWPDGRRLQRRGLLADFPVHPTRAGIREGRDEVLDHAIDILEVAILDAGE